MIKVKQGGKNQGLKFKMKTTHKYRDEKSI